MATEQPPAPAPKSKLQAVASAPWLPAGYVAADVSAIQAVHRGDASPEQQRRALEWIVKEACLTYDFAFRPGANDRDTNLALGRQLVGQQIVKMLYLNASALPRKEPRADPPEG